MPSTRHDVTGLLARVYTLISQSNCQAYVVGGFVRDQQSGRDTADIDIAVSNAAPRLAREIADAFGGKYVLLNEANNIARVVLQDSQNIRYLDFSQISDNIETDLARRDFTINAMAIELGALVSGSFNIIDPFHGQADLDSRLIRSVSDKTFQEDSVRLLRAIRLSKEMGFEIEAKTEKLIVKDAKLVENVPGERIREELLRLFSLAGSADTLRYMDELGLLTRIIPELSAMKGVEQPKEHYWHVFDHSIETVATTAFLLREDCWECASGDLLKSTPWSTDISTHFDEEISSGSNRRILLKLGGLLHDIAKPTTKTIEETGKMRFLGHGKLGALMVVAILERLRFSSREVKLVQNLVYHHLRPAQMSNEGLPTHRAIFRYFRDTDGAGIDILFLALADYLATSGPNLNISEWNQHNEMINFILSEHSRQETEVIPVKLIDGHDIIYTLGISPGPIVGELLAEVREAQVAGDLRTKEEAIALARQCMKKRYNSFAS